MYLMRIFIFCGGVLGIELRVFAINYTPRPFLIYILRQDLCLSHSDFWVYSYAPQCPTSMKDVYKELLQLNSKDNLSFKMEEHFK